MGLKRTAWKGTGFFSIGGKCLSFQEEAPLFFEKRLHPGPILRDTVHHFDPAQGTGNGSVFKDPDGSGLAWAIGEVLRWYGLPESWARLRENGMAEDFSWHHQAPHYEALYARLTGTP